MSGGERREVTSRASPRCGESHVEEQPARRRASEQRRSRLRSAVVGEDKSGRVLVGGYSSFSGAVSGLSQSIEVRQPVEGATTRMRPSTAFRSAWRMVSSSLSRACAPSSHSVESRTGGRGGVRAAHLHRPIKTNANCGPNHWKFLLPRLSAADTPIRIGPPPWAALHSPHSSS